MSQNEQKRIDAKNAVIQLWAIKKGIAECQARHAFESSRTCDILMNLQSPWWKESAAYICEKFQYELDQNWEMWMR